MDGTGLRILVIQTAFIGDVVLTTPMLRALRRSRPDAEITVLVKPEAAPFLKGHPDIDDVMVFDKGKEHRYGGMLRLIRQIRAKKFHVLLSPHQSHRTGLLAMFSGIPVRYGYASAGFAQFAYNRHLKRDLSEHEIYRLLLFLKEGYCPELPPVHEIDSSLILAESQSSALKAVQLLDSLAIGGRGSKPVLLAISSIWPTKRWTPYGFAELAGRLFDAYGQEILLVGSKGDSAIADQVLSFAREMLPASTLPHIRNICGQTDLLTLFSLMKRSMLVVSNDSAPVHFGCAAGVPVVAIFGATAPSLGYAPIAPRSAVAEIDLPCRPCGTHGAKKCPLEHFRCMKDLTAAQVFEKVRAVVE
ncbi:MAG: lipopolysaccharide heptosyltransferase II [Leptonema illini]|uniref:lipopolysaccharide heptosyltransferase II n=1 Tax=Leptonema illini TaxID=183 RepID=A0A833H2C5_9LEPT|nr:MAG: lipopolysaccharide heptosyltransferase II [Leptonema illini]